MILLCRKSFFILSTFLCLWGLNAPAQDSELERLQGFAKHQKENLQYDKARQQGERAFLEEEEQWESKKQRELKAYKKQAQEAAMSDDGPEFKEDLKSKKREQAQYEKDHVQYIAKRNKQKNFDRLALGLPDEMRELGLDVTRPRYDYRRRASFGASSKYGKNAGGPSGGFSGGGGNSGPSNGNHFPPPPSFDDFQDNYIPAPTLNDDFGGDVPPPPPPPPAFGEGFGDDFPPPLPPPPNYGGDQD